MEIKSLSHKSLKISSRAQKQVSSFCVVLVFAVVFGTMTISSIRDKSLTVDELTYISSGYYMLATGDLSLHSGHPIFIQMFNALPLLAMDLRLPRHKTPFFEPGKYSNLENWKYGFEFLYKTNREKAEHIIFLSRLMVVLLAIILGVYVFAWAKALYGIRAGFFALFLYVFSPNILAHSRLATLEIGITALTFIAVYYFRKLMFTPTAGHLLAAGIFFGLALVSKITSGLLIPVFLLYMLLFLIYRPPDPSLSNNRTAQLPSRNLTMRISLFFGVLIIAWFVILLSYGFQDVFKPLDTFAAERAAAVSEKIHSMSGVPVNGFIGSLPVPFPASFIDAFEFQYDHALKGHPTFMMGHYSTKGWWYYHLFAFLVKVPIPVLLLSVMSFVFIISKLKSREIVSIDEYILFIPIISIFSFVSLGNIKEGFRHLIPVMPFLFVLISKLVTIKWRRKKLVVPAFVILCGWYVFSSISIYPHYLAYFNELIGGPKNGYKYFVDSNLDWGQDLKGLKNYMNENNISKIKLSYFGSGDPSLYGIDYEPLPSIGLKPPEPHMKWWYEKGYEMDCGPVSGTLAVSATNLQGLLFRNHDCFAWLDNYESVKKIGYSIFVYRIPAKADNQS